MEELQQPHVEAPFSFPPHRRSHLRSGTYRNLVQLISLCYGDSPLATAPPIIPLHRTPDNGSSRGEAGGDDDGEAGESILSDNMLAQQGKVVDGGFGDTQMVVDEIKQIMQIEEGQDLINQNDLIFDSSMERTGFQDGEIGRQQMLMNELENIMKGNEDCPNSNNNCLATLLDRNQGDNCLDISMSHQEEPIDFTLVGKEFGTTDQTQVDMDSVNQKIIEAFGSSSDESLTVEDSKPSEEVEKESSLLKTNAMHEKIESQKKLMDLEKFVCSNDKKSSSNQMVEEEELEEGEIFGDIQLVSESIDTLLQDALVLEKKEEEKRVSGGGLDHKHLHCNEVSSANEQDSEIAQNADRVREADPEGSERGQIVSKLEKMHTKKGSAKILKQSGSENAVTNSKLKKDVSVCNKKNQGPSSAEKKKEKKKKNKRKRRAEKNQQLGVKRLKLQTVLKPKAVAHCRHYLKGRCYEGEKCKYSHDTVPLTKSQPCCHFARQSCMKGDDCPFDHQLSKYPCTGYVTKGFCPRGDDCLFSHKMSRDVASLSNDRELQPKPSLLVDSSMRLNMNRNVEASSCSVGAFSQKTKQIVAETPTKTSDPARKGVNCQFLSQSSIAQASKPNQGSSSQNMEESGRAGIQSNQNTSVVNRPLVSKPSLAESGKVGQGGSSLKMSKGIQANQSESGAIQIVNGSPKRKTEVVPRGINFLSFGKSSFGDSASKVSWALNRGDGYKQPIDNNQSTQSTSSTDQRKSHPAVVPLGISNIRSNEASILSSSDMVNNGSIQKSTHAADKQHNPSAISYKLPVSELLSNNNTPNSASKVFISTSEGSKKLGNVSSGSAYGSEYFSHKQSNSNPNPWKMPAYQLATDQSSDKMSHKNTPTSAQKALMSTLAFAAKFESGMKKNQSALTTGVNSETSNSRVNEGSRIDSEKTSKLLEFLSTVGSKIKKI